MKRTLGVFYDMLIFPIDEIILDVFDENWREGLLKVLAIVAKIEADNWTPSPYYHALAKKLQLETDFNIVQKTLTKKYSGNPDDQGLSIASTLALLERLKCFSHLLNFLETIATSETVCMTTQDFSKMFGRHQFFFTDSCNGSKKICPEREIFQNKIVEVPAAYTKAIRVILPLDSMRLQELCFYLFHDMEYQIDTNHEIIARLKTNCNDNLFKLGELEEVSSLFNQYRWCFLNDTEELEKTRASSMNS